MDEIPDVVRATILFKLERLLAEQSELAKRREELLSQQRRNDRDLAECRGAARFFDIDIEQSPRMHPRTSG